MEMGVVDKNKIGDAPGIKIFLYGLRSPFLPEMHVFLGSLISATDPVATLSVFSEMDAPPLLYNLVFGESILNDAVSIILFRAFEDLLDEEIHWYTIFIVIGKILKIPF